MLNIKKKIKEVNLKIKVIGSLFLVTSILLLMTITMFNPITSSSNKEAYIKLEDMIVTDTIGDVSIEMIISDFDGTFANNDSVGKVVTLTAYYPTQTVGNKSLTLTVPEGLAYAQNGIPVPESFSIPSTVDTKIINELGEGQPLATQAIKDVVLPDKHVATGSTFNKVTYNLNDTADKIVLTFYVKGDGERIYADHDIINDLIATATYNDTTVTTSVDVKADLKTTDLISYERPNVYASATSVASKSDEIIYNYTRSPFEVWEMPYLKSGKITLYYPVGTEFIGVVGYNYNYPTKGTEGYTITIDEEIGKVVYEFTDNYFYPGTSVKYKIPEGMSAGIYETSGTPEIEFTTYDGSTYKYIPVSSDKDKDGIVDDGFVFDDVEIKDRSDYGSPINLTQTSNVHPLYETEYSHTGLIKLKNDNPFMTENLMYEVILDENYEAKRVKVPKGKDFVSLEYKTNKSDEYISLDITGFNGYLDAGTVGLGSDEYFTEVKANIGKLSAGYYSYGPTSVNHYTNTLAYGMQKSGISEVIHTVSMWVEGNEADTKVTVDTNSKLDSYTSNMTLEGTSVMKKDGVIVTAVTAGDTVTAEAHADIFNYLYGNSLIMENPYFILRESNDITIHESTIKIINPITNKELNFNVDKIVPSNSNLDTYYKLTLVDDITIGQFISYPFYEQKLKVSFDFTTSSTSTDSYIVNIKDIFGFANDGAKGSARDGSSLLENGVDLNNNGTTTDKIPTSYSYPLTINKNNHVVVDTYLSFEDTRYPSYMPSYPETAVNFTPEFLASYNITIKNSSPYEATDFVLYFPIPKEGENFGESYQSEPFKYNMKLSSLLPNLEGFEVTYASGVTKDTITTASYTKTPSDLDSINMIKVTATKEIGIGTTTSVEVPIVIDETLETTESKISEMNIFNPYYTVDYVVYSGWKKGSSVGAKLVLMNIEGTMFKDINFDGLYDPSVDEVLPDIEIELHRKESDGTYLPVTKDSKVVTTITDSNGHYQFNHETIGEISEYMIVPVMDKYPLLIETAYQNGSDYKIDSDIQTGDDGVRNIDPTLDPASFINLGYIEKQELSLDVPELIVLSSLEEIQYLLIDNETNNEGFIGPYYFESLGGTYEVSANSSVISYQTFTSGDEYLKLIAKEVTNKDVIETDLVISLEDRYKNTISKSSKILVVGSERESSLGLSAIDATISNSEAKSITSDKVLEVTDAIAYSNITGDTLEITTSSLEEIKNTTYLGGTYKVTLSTSEGSITVNINVEDTFKTDASLNDIKVNGVTIDNFDKETLAYNITVPYETESINLYASTSDSDATIDNANIGIKNLSVGLNTYNIEVTAHDINVKKTYTVNITRSERILDSNNLLASLVIKGQVMNPTFNSSIKEYNLTVPYEISDLEVTAIAESSLATVLVTGNNDLVVGNNTITIKVTAENSSVNTYTINVNREEKIILDTNNYLSSLEVKNHIINPLFDKEVNDYNLTVNYEVKDLELLVSTESDKATTEILGNNNLVVGDNTVTVKVTAENSSVNTYTIIVTREEKVLDTNNYLKELVIENYELVKTFDKESLEYSLEIPYEVNKLNITALTESDLSNVEISGNSDLSVGENTISITVTAEDNSTRIYTILVTKLEQEIIPEEDILPPTEEEIIPPVEDEVIVKPVVNNVVKSNDNNLKSLQISNHTIKFDRDILIYDITVENDVNALELFYELSNSKATAEILGNNNLVVGNNKIEIIVTAEDNSTKIYTINILKLSDTSEDETDILVEDDNDDSKKDTDKITTDNSNNNLMLIIIGVIITIIVAAVIIKSFISKK